MRHHCIGLAMKAISDVAEVLLAKGADIKATNIDSTPLYLSNSNGHADVAEFLPLKRANIRSQGK